MDDIFYHKISDSLNNLNSTSFLNCLENQRSNFLLKNQIHISDEMSSKLYDNNNILYDIESQLETLFYYVQKKDAKEEYQNFAKDLIYKIKKKDEEIDKIEDKLFAFYKRSELFAAIHRENLTSEVFTEISDKEYFDKVQTTIWRKIQSIGKTEYQNFLSLFKELILFIETAKKILKGINDYKKIINIPSNYNIPDEPQAPKILNAEEGFFKEIQKNSESKEIDIWSGSAIKEYCSTTDDLPQFFESLSEQKHKYMLDKALYDFLKDIEASIKFQKEFDDYQKKRKIIAKKITVFLKEHPLFAFEFPDSLFGTLFEDSIYDIQTVDFNILKENVLKQTEMNFDDFYKKGKSLIEDRSKFLEHEKINEKQEEIKKRKTTVKIIISLILIILAIILIRKLYIRNKEIQMQQQKIQRLYELNCKIENIVFRFNSNRNGPTLEEMIELEAETHDAQIQFYIGERYFYDKQLDSSFQSYNWIKLSAAQNNADGLARLGWFYLIGKSVDKDYEKALGLIKKSVDMGSSYGENFLGYMYENGEGVKKSIQEAEKWYRQSAEKGNCFGQNNLSRFYHNGIVVSKDYKESVKWLRMAAEQGLDISQYNFGISYLNGAGVEKDEAHAYNWFRKAAEQDFVDAEYNVGIMLCLGFDSERNESGLDWLGKAAKHCDAESIRFLEHPILNSIHMTFFRDNLEFNIRNKWINTPYN